MKNRTPKSSFGKKVVRIGAATFDGRSSHKLKFNSWVSVVMVFLS